MSGLRKEYLIGLMAVLLTVVVCTGQALAQPAATGSPTTAPAAKPLDVVYVFSPTCLNCKEASKFVEAAVRRYGQRIRVQRLNIQEPDALDRVLALEERYKAAAAAPPRVFIGSRYLTGLDAISEQLDTAIGQELKALATSQPDGRPGTSTRPDSGASLTRPRPAAKSPVESESVCLRRVFQGVGGLDLTRSEMIGRLGLSVAISRRDSYSIAVLGAR